MRPENAIEVRNLRKMFKVYYDKGHQLKERLLFWKRNRYEERWVLNGIDFDVKKGEAVGLIGHNGCGKSTTLKLLTKIIYPNEGTIEMCGRVSSLIELGAGFHPDMSGRENIYINAAIFGLSRKEIDTRLNDIIEFSELEEFIDNPVRTYSSGMYMRLAFSVAINVDADILLIDEILAVGDAGFQAKCFQKLKEIKRQGTTIVIVSHAMGQIEQICDKSIWINKGKIKKIGAPKDIHPQYLEYIARGRKDEEEWLAEHEAAKAEAKAQAKAEQEAAKAAAEEGGAGIASGEAANAQAEMAEGTNVDSVGDAVNHEGGVAEAPASQNRYGNMHIRITNIDIINSHGEKTQTVLSGEAFKIQIHYKVNKPEKDIVFGVGFWNMEGKNCYGTNTLIDHIYDMNLEKDGMIEFNSDQMVLLEGKYILQVAITDINMLPIDYWNDAYTFDVKNSVGDIGICRLPHKWEF